MDLIVKLVFVILYTPQFFGAELLPVAITNGVHPAVNGFEKVTTVSPVVVPLIPVCILWITLVDDTTEEVQTFGAMLVCNDWTVPTTCIEALAEVDGNTSTLVALVGPIETLEDIPFVSNREVNVFAAVMV